MADESKDVGMPMSAYDDYMDIIDLPKALYGGTKAMREKGEIYLPKDAEETSASFAVRLSRSVLLNIFKRTIQKMSGEVFSRDLIMKGEPKTESFEICRKDIDARGNSIDRFGRRLFEFGLRDGVCHIFVDAPSLETRDTKGQTFVNDNGSWIPLNNEYLKRTGWRPYFVMVNADSLIGYRTVYEQGIRVLDQVRFKSVVSEPVGEYAVEDVTYVYVVYRGRTERWKQVSTAGGNKEERWVLDTYTDTGLDFIPIVTYMPGEPINDMMAEPPLDGLAWLNLMHWQSSSDQRNILHYMRMAVYFGKGLELDEGAEGSKKIVFGANRLIRSESEWGDLKVVEHSGKGIDSGRDDLKDLESQMALFGLTFLTPKKSAVSATERYLDYSENQASLKNWGKDLDEALSKALAIMGVFYNDTWTVEVDSNKDFKTYIEDQDSRLLVEAFLANILPRELVFNELKRRGVVSDLTQFEELTEMFTADRRLGISTDNQNVDVVDNKISNQVK